MIDFDTANKLISHVTCLMIVSVFGKSIYGLLSMQDIILAKMSTTCKKSFLTILIDKNDTAYQSSQYSRLCIIINYYFVFQENVTLP